MLRKKMVETFFIPEHKMRFELEFEGEGSVYLYKSKNYILRKNDDALLTIKGSSFKGYDKAKVISDAVTIMSNAIMYKTKSYEEAMKEATSIRNRPLEDFKFTKSIHKLPSEYKDYDDIFIIFSGFSRENLTKKEVIKTIKDRLIMWIKDHIKSGKRSSELCSLVRGAKTEEELLSIANSLTIKQSNKDKTKLPFMLQICLTMMERGRKIETDMYVDYFWTLTPHGYTLYEDMNGSIYIDYDRYSKEIGRIIERFSFADPAFTSSFLFNDEEIEGFYIDKSSDEENNNDEVEE